MLNFKRNKNNAPKFLKKNEKAARPESSAALKKVQRNIYWQASLALVTIVLTIVIVFAMTSAWYTNIAQTSGLAFQAEAWGFDGEITVNDASIEAAPGDEGAIHLEVANSSESITAVGVTVSKASMEKEMQKRLYFYVDTQLTRNDETMNRVYLNSLESYTYTLFSQGKLTLTEEMHNNSQLKWQWVYDVLGYYVLGTRTSDGNNVTEMEYLRPIEYDYDEATTTFEADEEGNLTMALKTVDGETTAEDFLVELSKTDGYEGQIDPSGKLESGYYPVDVDEKGYGVYAYLCSFSEIEMATRYDTQLGEAAASGENVQTYEAKLMISAQKNDDNLVSIGTLASLEQAIAGGTSSAVQLNSDITITQTNNLVIPEGAQVMLDLNGHTITSTSGQVAIEAEPGSSLTVINGTIVGPGNGYAVYTTGAEAVFSNVDISNFQYGFYMGDNEDGNALDSRVRLIDCEVNASSCAVFISGNGLASEQDSQLVIERCKLYSDSVVISGNGSTSGNGRWGTDIQVIDSELVSNPNNVGVAIYQPQKDSTLTVYNSTVSGYTGIAIKGGCVSINASQVTGTGARQAPINTGSGCSDTGDAVYIETNYGFEILLEIGGGSVLRSTHGYSLQVFEPDADNVSVTIYSGSFEETQPDEYIANGSVQNGSTVTVGG